MAEIAVRKPLAVTETPIPGFLRIDLTVLDDNRGWFKENWQRAKLVALGLPDFAPVQNNVSFNDEVGVTRGIHAEPWDKLVSVVHGRVFGAWVDLRAGESFGRVYTCEIDPSVAVFVPRGVGNSYQTLEPNTVYTYLVNEHWRAGASYVGLNLADETVAIDWPIPLEGAIQSEKDLNNPCLGQVEPFTRHDLQARRVLVTGANGQLGRELMSQLGPAGFAATGVDLPEFDIADQAQVDQVNWADYDIIINAAAWTNVDGAETAEGRRAAWASNAIGVANLARAATANGLRLVQISSEYVFDGTRDPHTEDEVLSPLGVYGQSKAAGDAVVSAVPRHYLVRTSWVVGAGHNFVRTMAGLAAKGVDPAVVDDQVGRLTFTTDLAAGVLHLLSNQADYGTYNLSNAGEVTSWYQIAARVYELTGHDPSRVRPISTTEYFAGKQAAPRPLCSTLDLSKITATGFVPADAGQRLVEYLAELG